MKSQMVNMLNKPYPHLPPVVLGEQLLLHGQKETSNLTSQRAFSGKDLDIFFASQ
jgi:hypothetical protein